MARQGNSRTPLDDLADQINIEQLVPLIYVGLPVLVILVGLFTSYHIVEPEGRAVVKRFGKVVAIREPGLNFKLPFWIDQATFVPTERVLKEEFGFRAIAPAQRTTYDTTRDYSVESLMLTGDLNVIDVDWVVQYRIIDPHKYMHALYNPTETIRDIAESVMRRIVGNRLGSDVLTVSRVEIALLAQEEMHQILNEYDIGVKISTVELQGVTPPDAVKPSFNEVNMARAQQKKRINEAEKTQNEEIPRAQGEAQQLIDAAEGYKVQRVNQAKGEAARFESIYREYKEGRKVTRQRMYLEAIDQVMGSLGKLYIVEDGQMAPLPLLNLGGEQK